MSATFRRLATLATTMSALWMSQALAIDLNPSVKPGSSPDGFHPPSTPAEQALDRVILLNDKEPDLARFATGNKDRDQSKDPRLAPYFSQGLRDAWAAAEATAARRNCGGRHVAGESCGLDINPVTCSPDSSPNGYVYRTESTDGDRTTLSYRWPRTTEVIATYRLIRSSNRWIVDGVTCVNYLKFNME